MMLPVNRVVWAAALWLLLWLSSASAIHVKRQTPQTQGQDRQDIRLVYIWDTRSPQTIRSNSGFWPALFTYSLSGPRRGVALSRKAQRAGTTTQGRQEKRGIVI
ncbi:hypothetical protein XA68_14758 [Ophiocordyceps unilateralis]|uniref:Uncharacterized protein n=1 Tax=Ophiocordyceps unilateralis TaxID=268505 RepID=A0A2A9P8L0_OPHUN|nr:hypothetical protein XA68_14758 [Ophiocordyceps unilateralis]